MTGLESTQIAGAERRLAATRDRFAGSARYLFRP
jgi:hypothetical protein